MEKWLRSFLAFLILGASAAAHASDKAEHVVVVVWDGLRPDFVRPQYTPTLFEFAGKGTFFANHHSAYITSTEVNGTALVTGMHPDHSGVIANTSYRQDLGWLNSYGTENFDAVRRADLLTEGHYLEAATVPEILQGAGFPTATVGAKPVTLLHDRSAKKTTPAQQKSVTIFRGQSLPRAAVERLVRTPEVGPFPTNFPSFAAAGATNAPTTPATPGSSAGFPFSRSRRGSSVENADSWSTRALVRGLWKDSVPKYSLLWLSEPDASQHAHGLGSPESVAALGAGDDNFALLLKALEDKGALEKTDIFVVSDHGFSTISHATDIIESLKRAKFVAAKQFENPEPGDVMVINLGGSVAFYVFDHDEATVRRLIAFLQTSDFAGVIFSALENEGTFPLAEAHLAPGKGAPDVVMSLRWTDERNENGVPGMIASVEGRRGLGTHASLSRFDLHNTLIAGGPDFKPGYVNHLPSGNIDLAPTVLHVLGVVPPQPMDGRVLSEALQGKSAVLPKPDQKVLEASRDLGVLRWRQTLKTTRVGYSLYFDEGNGVSLVRP